MVLLEGRAQSRPPQESATTERGPPGNVALEGRAQSRPPQESGMRPGAIHYI